jgi:exopolysaccharide production protein ExoZ
MSIKYNSIQALRAVAAILVTLMHLLFFYGDSIKYLGTPPPRMSEFYYFKGFGGCGVQIFFVISGFIMAFLHEKGETRSILEFSIRRITRIVPLYWAATLFLFFAIAGSENIPLPHLLHSLFFIPEPNNQTVLGPGWSLNYEMFFYALFGICTFTFRKSITWITATFLLLDMVSRTTDNYIARLYSDPIIWNFLAGIAIWHIHRLGIIQNNSKTIFFIGISMLISSIFYHLPNDSKGIRQVIPWGIPSMIIVLGIVSMESAGKQVKFLENKVLLTIGEASYALYLVHGLCFFGISNILLYQLKIQEIINPDGAVIAYLIICCAIAIAVHKWIEIPLIMVTRKAIETLSHAIRH